MSDYSKTTDFTSKDTLPSGNPAKTIKGSDFDLEFSAVQAASEDKTDFIAAATDNNLLSMTATGYLKDSTIATDGAGTITADLIGDVTGALTGNADTATNATTAANLSGSNLTGDVSNTANAMSVDSVQADAVDTAGVQDNAITDSKLASPSTGSTVIKRVIGTTPTSGTSTSYPTWNATYTTTGLVVIGTALVSGVINVTFEINNATSSTTYAKIMVNGVTQGAEATDTGPGYLPVSRDCTVTTGDLIQLAIRASGSTWNVKNLVANADSAKLCIA